MAVKWTFRAYISPSGRKDVENWYGKLPFCAQAAFDTVLEYLDQRDVSEWRMPEFKKLTGRQSGLSEIRFDAKKVEYRVFGMFGPGRNEFTILIGSYKKSKSYNPRNALESAVERAKQIENGQAGTYVWGDGDD